MFGRILSVVSFFAGIVFVFAGLYDQLDRRITPYNRSDNSYLLLYFIAIILFFMPVAIVFIRKGVSPKKGDIVRKNEDKKY